MESQNTKREPVRQKFFKVLQGTKSFCGGDFDWKSHLPSAKPHGTEELEWTSGEWTPHRTVCFGTSGWHVYTERGLDASLGDLKRGNRRTVWLVQGFGHSGHGWNCEGISVFETVRLLRPATQEELDGMWEKCQYWPGMQTVVKGLPRHEDEHADEKLRKEVAKECASFRRKTRGKGPLASLVADTLLAPLEDFARGTIEDKKDALRAFRKAESLGRGRGCGWTLERCLCGDAVGFMDDVEGTMEDLLGSSKILGGPEDIRRAFPTWPLATVTHTMLTLPEKNRGGWKP